MTHRTNRGGWRGRTGTGAYRGAAAALGVLMALGSAAEAQRRGRGSPPLGEGPWVFNSAEHRFQVSVVTRELSHPWSLAFLPDGTMLISERPGRLRLVRNDVLDPTPIAGLPEIHVNGLAGLMDVALHPDFARSHLVYFTYAKAGPRGKTVAVGRGRLEGMALHEVQDIFVAEAWHEGNDLGDGRYGSRLAFDGDGLLYVTIGERDRTALVQDPSNHFGKLLRLREDGSVPDDNPFVGRPGYRPEIYSLGHRNQQGLAFHPETGALWANEHGPLGGDELNAIRPGGNYGWPLVTYGLDYTGEPLTEATSRPGLEDPFLYWVPSIGVSGLTFYTGDRFPGWKGNAFVGSMMTGRLPVTGHLERLAFYDGGRPGPRESLLVELHQRIRDIRQGPDDLLYALTDEDEGALLRIEPAP